jgi:hypothetical protein
MIVKPWMFIAGYFLWLVVMGIAIMSAFGCGQLAVAEAPDGGGQLPEAQVVEPEQDEIPNMGMLPPGYYQRQCQWDACGGPLPNNTQRMSNPQPDRP